MKMIRTTAVGVAIIIICLGVCAFARKTSFPQPPPYYPLPTGEFPIQATYAFYPPYLTDQQFKWVKEAGFNILVKSLTVSEEDTLLDLAAKNGLYLDVAVWALINPQNLPGNINHFKNRPGVWGYSVADEPNASRFAELAKALRTIESLDPKANTFINLLPEMPSDYLKAPDYRAYLEEFIRTVNPPFLSFDAYPVRMDKNGKIFVLEGYFNNLEMISSIAKESGRPFWNFVCSTKHLFYPTPTEGFIRFQVFSSLAYGAQGISYYTYVVPDFDIDKGDYSDAPINRAGERTPVWYMVRNVNHELQTLADIFLGVEVKNVSFTGKKLPKGTKRLKKAPAPFRKIESGDEGLIVSHLSNGGKEYLLLVNRDVVNSQQVSVPKSRSVVRLYGDGSRKTDFSSEITLDPGGYALFML